MPSSHGAGFARRVIDLLEGLHGCPESVANSYRCPLTVHEPPLPGAGASGRRRRPPPGQRPPGHPGAPAAGPPAPGAHAPAHAPVRRRRRPPGERPGAVAPARAFAPSPAPAPDAPLLLPDRTVVVDAPELLPEATIDTAPAVDAPLFLPDGIVATAPVVSPLAWAPQDAPAVALAGPPPAPGRVITTVGWMPGVEALRGLAATAVVVFHMWALTTLPRFQGYELVLGLGVWAVDLFFLLSGFLLVQSFWEQPRTQSLGQYYVRRAFRIVPAYYVCLAVLFVFFANRDVLYSGIGLKQVAANLTFTQWFSPTTASSLNVSGVFWTLSIEMVLYALLPLLAWAIARRPLILGGFLFAVGFAYRLYVTIDPQWLQDKVFRAVPDMHEDLKRLFLLRQFPGVLPLFVIGMLLRWWLHYRPGVRPATAAPRTSVLVLLALLIPSIVMLTPGQKAVDFRNAALFAVFDVAIVVLLAPALVYAARTVVGRLSFLMKTLVWLGRRSYGIYLWHFPAVLIALDRGPLERGPTMSNVWARLAAAGVATLVLGALSYRLVERPSLAAGRRLAARLA